MHTIDQGTLFRHSTAPDLLELFTSVSMTFKTLGIFDCGSKRLKMAMRCDASQCFHFLFLPISYQKLDLALLRCG